MWPLKWCFFDRSDGNSILCKIITKDYVLKERGVQAGYDI